MALSSQAIDVPPTPDCQASATTSGRPMHSEWASSRQITYRQYAGEQDLPMVMELIDNELSEPYSIFTYRFFLHNWPELCWLAFDEERCFATVVCKLEPHGDLLRGYLAMLVVISQYRGLGIGSELVKRSIQQMLEQKADEVTLEAEVTNKGALALYQNLGFIRDKRLTRYYLSGSDAFRLKLMLPLHPDKLRQMQEEQLRVDQMDVAEDFKRLSKPGHEQSHCSHPHDCSGCGHGAGGVNGGLKS